jgi:hypothetical protein
MKKHGPLGFSIVATSGIALMVLPFAFPHMASALAAVLFDGGAVVAVACMILLFVEAKERYG